VSSNLDLVRSIYADWERGDFSSADWAHPAIQFEIVGGAEPGIWSGVSGMARAWFRFLDAWEDYHVEAEQYRALDPERVFVLIRRTGRGRTSQLEIGGTETADLFHIRDGKVTRLVHYWERSRALADLGLEE
jgi:ketosteroid isomerase-like protein